MVRRKSEPRSNNGQEGSSRPSEKSARSRRLKNRPPRKRRVLSDIIYLKKTTHLLIPKASFIRLVRQVFIELYSRIYRIQLIALQALQEALEMYMVQFFEDSFLLTSHAKRVTLMWEDMIMNRRLRGRDDIINK